MKRFASSVLFLLVLGVVSLAVSEPAAAAPEPRAERILVFSVPTLGFADVSAAEMPNLSAFLDQGAVADLSVRVDGMSTSIADGYATLAAGTRTRGAARMAGWGFNVGEQVGPTTAGEEYTRRTGTPADDGLVYLAQPELRVANRDARFGSEIGAMGDALAQAGWSRAVIANADTVGTEVRYERTAMTGLADATGRVPQGLVDQQLLMPDPAAAYGLRLDPEVVDRQFRAAWTPRSVVMVEASDLWRAALAGEAAADSAAIRTARTTSDALFGRMLESVDPQRDAVFVVSPRYGGDTLALTMAGLQAPGTPPGYLTSATTRRPGFVQLVDIAPSILAFAGVPIPESMEGRAVTAVKAPDPSARRNMLVTANDAARFRDAVIGPVTAFWIAAQVVLCALAVMLFASPRFARFRRWLAPAALALLAFPLGLWLAGPLPFFRWGMIFYAVFLGCVACALAALALLVLHRRRIDPVIGVLGTLVAVLLFDVVTGAHLQFNTVFGYSPTIAGRFAGIGNLAYAVLGASAIFLAGLLAHRIGGRRGRIAAGALLIVVCLVDGLPFFGADVGGMLSLIPATAILLWLLSGRTLRVRTALIVGAATVAIVTLVGVLDLQRPAAERTHLGRLLERVGDQGWSGLWTVLERKAASNLGVLGLSIWTMLIPILFILLGVLLYKAPGRLREVQTAIPELRATLIAFGVLAVLGFALNDSGIAIPGVMLGIANGVLIFLSARVGDSFTEEADTMEVYA